jgi:hypothetical protein
MSGLELLGAASAILGILGAANSIQSSVREFFSAPEVGLLRDEIRQFTLTWPAIQRILEDQEPDLDPEMQNMLHNCLIDTTEVLQQTRVALDQFIRADNRLRKQSLKRAAYTHLFRDSRSVAGAQSTKRWRAFFQQDTIRIYRERLQMAHRYLTLVFHTLT